MNRHRPRLTLDLCVEVAPSGGCFGHIPSLPGLCFRATAAEQLREAAAEEILKYAQWLDAAALTTLTPETMILAECVGAGHVDGVDLVEAERLDGSPVWISGNPAALFACDRAALDNGIVRARMQFTQRVIHHIWHCVSGLTRAQRAWRPGEDRRSLDETLTHIGNCVWWYCSRIDDTLPEPIEHSGEDPIMRTRRLVILAKAFLLVAAAPERKRIHVPSRFQTSDPEEPWTHGKACRRQAEHVWEHLTGLARAVEAARQG